MDNTVPDADAPGRSWKIGTLARGSGLTVRTLHHYDHIGLLRPSGRTAAGHRAYSGGDVARLYRITLLRRLGSRYARSLRSSTIRAGSSRQP